MMIRNNTRYQSKENSNLARKKFQRIVLMVIDALHAKKSMEVEN